MAEPDDWKDRTLSELTDEEAGRWIKMFAAEVDKWAAGKWTADAERTVALAALQGAQMVKMALESNAGAITINAQGVKVRGEMVGDWVITIKRKSAKLRAA